MYITNHVDPHLLLTTLPSSKRRITLQTQCPTPPVGVLKRQRGRVQAEAWRQRGRARAAVELVSQQRVADVRHVEAQLVRAAGDGR